MVLDLQLKFGTPDLSVLRPLKEWADNRKTFLLKNSISPDKSVFQVILDWVCTLITFVSCQSADTQRESASQTIELIKVNL